jgi:hypothetical protein
VFAAMIAAGTPCPIDGKIGTQAKAEWDSRGVLADDKKVIGFYGVPPKKAPAAVSETPEVK